MSEQPTADPRVFFGVDVGSLDSTVMALYDGGRLLDLCTYAAPKFRKMREVHAQRARKLRRRGEYLHFLRWEHGHCIYGWGGPIPDTFYMRMPPR